MAVKIRLKRMGKIRAPYYRIVVADSRTKRDGRVIEEIGKYHPKDDPSLIEVRSERAQYWLGVGAQPTEAVAAILKVTGDLQRFRGETDAQGTLKVKEPGRSKQDIFNEILKESGAELDAPAAAPKKRTAKKAAASQPEGSADQDAAEQAAEQVEAASAAAPAEEAQQPAEASTDEAARTSEG